MLRLPKKPIEKNNTSSKEILKYLIWGTAERKNPRRKEEKLLMIRIATSLSIFNFSSFLYNINLILAPNAAPIETKKTSFNL